MLSNLRENLSFKNWLAYQINRDDFIGDLAKDTKRDPIWGSATILNYTDAHTYFRNRGACREAIEALECAFNEWRSS